MRPLKLLPLMIVSNLLMFIFMLSSAQACKEGPTTALEPDEWSDEMRTDPVTPCPPITSDPAPACAQMNGSPPFNRHPSTSSAPSNTGEAGCFAVARRTDGYHLLFNEGFKRKESNDGGITWNNPIYVTIQDPAGWIQVNSGALAVQCPDPHFIGTNGQMILYFSAWRVGGGRAIGRATSNDNGVSWTVDPAPIIVDTPTYYPYMPSAIQISDGGYLLAYAWVCKGAGPTLDGASMDVIYSPNGIDNWVPRAIPGVPTGHNTFDDGSVNRPRLVRDPNLATKIHMFYSAYEWNGTAPTRHCGRIGHAFSNDDGFTWTKSVRPVFEPSFRQGWDSNQVLKPSLVVEPCQSDPSKKILRLFYEGGLTPIGLGIADAPWPFGSGLCTSAEITLQEEPAPEDEGALARLTSVPNPTRGTTTIEVDLSRAQITGEAELTIIDVTGRLVRHLWTGSSLTAPRSIDWDGRESGGARVAPGRYLARMRIGDTTAGAHWITMTR